MNKNNIHFSVHALMFKKIQLSKNNKCFFHNWSAKKNYNYKYILTSITLSYADIQSVGGEMEGTQAKEKGALCHCNPQAVPVQKFGQEGKTRFNFEIRFLFELLSTFFIFHYFSVFPSHAVSSNQYFQNVLLEK